MSLSHIAIAVVMAALWGFSFVAVKVGLHEVPPLMFAALRFIVVAVPAIFFVPRRGIAWKWIIAIGLSMGVCQHGLLYMGMNNGVPTGLSSLILQSQAIFTLLLTTVILKDAPTLQQWLGMGVSFLGLGAIALADFSPARLSGFILVVISGLAWAFGNIFVKQSGVKSGFRLFVWMAIVPPLPLMALSLKFETGQWASLTHFSWLSLSALLYSSLLASMVGFGVWGYLMHQYSPNVVAPFSLLVPVFGILFSVWCLGDTLSLVEGLGSLLVLIGLSLTVVNWPTAMGPAMAHTYHRSLAFLTRRG